MEQKAKQSLITSFVITKNKSEQKTSKNKSLTKQSAQDISQKKNLNSQEKSLLPPYDEFADGLCSWKKELQQFTSSSQWRNIYNFIEKEYQEKIVYPPAHKIFNAFQLTPFSKLKVVIVGQDPYHQPNQAMGLCFSVQKGVVPPPSLKNIYKNLSEDKNISNFKKPCHGNLTKWAQQGVLLLNDILTVVHSKPESHKKSGWAEFTNHVIKVINDQKIGIIFLLWGLPAQKKAAIVDEKKHHVLKSSHPSPLSASRGFLTCNHFSKVNNILKSKNQEEIDWNLD